MNRRHFILGSASLAAVSTLQLSRAESSSKAAQWRRAAPMPINTQELYPAVHQGKLYVAGGIASKLGTLYFTDRFFSYDPITDTWADEADLPESLHHAALVSTGDRLFLVGGFNGSLTQFWRMRDRVYEYIDGEWHARGALPKPQAEGVLAHHQGDVHLVTGQSPRGDANSKRSDHIEVDTHLVWQPGDSTWERAAPIPLATNSATGGWVNDQLVITGGDGIVVFGGEIFVPEAGVFKEVWRYSLSQDNWQAYPDMLTPRHGIGAGRIGDKAYIVGGATEPSGKGTSNVNEVLQLS